MKTRKLNLKDKIILVKNCLIMMWDGIKHLNPSQILLGWYLMTDGLRGRCEIMEDAEWED